METSDKRKVFVKLVPGHSVPRSVRESDLLNHFDTLKGKIEEVSAIRGRDTAQGFVRFKTQEAAKEAIARYHGTKLYGRFQIIVRPSRGKEENYPPATAHVVNYCNGASSRGPLRNCVTTRTLRRAERGQAHRLVVTQLCQENCQH